MTSSTSIDPTPTGTTHTRATLARDIRALGVVPGDWLFVHSSYKSLGTVDGGAATVVAALEDVLGPDGMLMFPSFNLVKDNREGTWNMATTPSTVGWLTEFFRQQPGVIRSNHYSHAVAARGRGAAELVSEHMSKEGDRSPWDVEAYGSTYGTRSPMIKAYRAGGKALMLGVNYHSSTYMHVVETRDWNRRLEQDPKAEYYWINRDLLGEHWDSLGRLRRGKMGDADCRLFPIRDFVDTLLEAVKNSPGRFYKWYPAAK